MKKISGKVWRNLALNAGFPFRCKTDNRNKWIYRKLSIFWIPWVFSHLAWVFLKNSWVFLWKPQSFFENHRIFFQNHRIFFKIPWVFVNAGYCMTSQLTVFCSVIHLNFDNKSHNLPKNLYFLISLSFWYFFLEFLIFFPWVFSIFPWVFILAERNGKPGY